MAVINQAPVAQEEVPLPGENQSFEDVEALKAKLFHTKKESLRAFGVQKSLKKGLLIAAALLSLAFTPLWGQVTDLQAVVAPARLVDLEALKYGKVESVQVRESDFVKEGDLLLTISNPEDERKIAELGHEVLLVRKQLEGLSRRRIYWFDRLDVDRTLLDEKVIAREEFEKTELQFHSLEEERVLLQTRLEGLKRGLEDYEQEKKRGEVRSPIAGKVISEVQMKQGSFVSRGEFIMTLAGEERQVEFMLREEDYGRVKVDDEASVRFYAFPHQTFRGQVVRVKHYAESRDMRGKVSTSIKVLIRLGHVPEGLRNGMSAKVRIKAEPVSVVDLVSRKI